MTILNATELQASIDTINDGGANTAAELRQVLTNQVDSLADYKAVIENGVVPGIAVPAGQGSAAKLETFTADSMVENALFKPEAANHRILIKEPGAYFTTVRFVGDWLSARTLNIGVYVNGAPNPVTPIIISSNGNGSGSPVTLSVTRIRTTINNALLAAGDTNRAVIEVYIWGDSAFTLNQTDVEVFMEYHKLSIRAVG
jgi:hypothetical protein